MQHFIKTCFHLIKSLFSVGIAHPASTFQGTQQLFLLFILFTLNTNESVEIPIAEKNIHTEVCEMQGPYQ
jgi:hypothetical protein